MKFYKKRNQKSKNLVLTMSMKEFPSTVGIIANKYIKLYAESIDSDFAIMEDKDSIYDVVCYNKFQISELLNEYERVLFIDNDIFVKKNSPDIFKIVPPDKFGIVEEFHQFRKNPHYLRMKNRYLASWWLRHNINEKSNVKFVGNKYYNSGTMVVSRETNVFKHKPIILESQCIHENHLLNKRIAEYNIPTFHLPDSFNYMITRRMPKRLSAVMKYIKSDKNFFIHLIRYNDPKIIKEKMMNVERVLYGDEK